MKKVKHKNWRTTHTQVAERKAYTCRDMQYSHKKTTVCEDEEDLGNLWRLGQQHPILENEMKKGWL